MTPLIPCGRLWVKGSTQPWVSNGAGGKTCPGSSCVVHLTLRARRVPHNPFSGAACFLGTGLRASTRKRKRLVSLPCLPACVCGVDSFVYFLEWPTTVTMMRAEKVYRRSPPAAHQTKRKSRAGSTTSKSLLRRCCVEGGSGGVDAGPCCFRRIDWCSGYDGGG